MYGQELQCCEGKHMGSVRHSKEAALEVNAQETKYNPLKLCDCGLFIITVVFTLSIVLSFSCS
jgi:hypothetical protein